MRACNFNTSMTVSPFTLIISQTRKNETKRKKGLNHGLNNAALTSRAVKITEVNMEKLYQAQEAEKGQSCFLP